MTWERRILEFLLAGGTLAAACTSSDGTGSTGGVPCGNANPDPCICGRPDSSAEYATQCNEKKACEAQGGQFDPTTFLDSDGGVEPPHCILDAGSGDASEDRAKSD
jgi:hypothetical protein